MIPKTLSATALDVAMTCLSRYKAENIDRTPQPSGEAAMRGSVFHGAAEMFVQKTIMDKSMSWEWDNLEMLLMLSYKDVYQRSDFDSEAYKDCLAMAKLWFGRTDVREVEVIELEKKRTFDLQTSVGSIPFTFIIDRLDRIGPGEYRVVDYKSIRAYISPDDLRSKIQARIYALAIQIEYPDAERIWVQFDMVRHETPPPSTLFTRQDNTDTWYRLIAEAERIIAVDENDPMQLTETVNNECMYCVRKSECSTLIRHTAGGGVHGKTGAEAARLKLEVASAIKALRILDEELNAILLTEAEQNDTFAWRHGDLEVKITAPKNTKLNEPAIMSILPPHLAAEFTQTKIGVTRLKELLKGDELNEEQKNMVKQYMTIEYGNPSPKVTRKPII